MTTDDCKFIRVPLWLASILATAILAFAADTWHTVQRLDKQLACLRSELAAKGLIDSKACVQLSPESSKFPDFSGVSVNQFNQQWPYWP